MLITAHGGSLCALIKHLENMPDGEIRGLNLPTGMPLVYRLDDNLNVLSHEYLGDPDEVHRA